MPESIFHSIMISLLLGVGVLAAVSFLVRFVKNRYAPVKTVRAVVVDKNKVETFSKYSGTGKSEKYVVVFSVDGKKKSFYVSQFSYNGYKINQKGTLKYKGDKLMEFK